MPTLEEWIQLYEDSPDILLNIDMKMPSESYRDDNFDVNQYAKSIVNLIEKYDIAKKTIVETYN